VFITSTVVYENAQDFSIVRKFYSTYTRSLLDCLCAETLQHLPRHKEPERTADHRKVDGAQASASNPHGSGGVRSATNGAKVSTPREKARWEKDAWWNHQLTDRQWREFWAKVFLGLYVFAVFITMVSPRWHLLWAGLIGCGLGWLFTMSRYSHKSQTQFLYCGGWWDSIDGVKKDRELWNVSARHIFTTREDPPRLCYDVKYFIRTNLGPYTMEGTVSGYCRKDCEEKAQDRLTRYCEAMENGEKLLEANFQMGSG
jgi:hypothetical protein